MLSSSSLLFKNKLLADKFEFHQLKNNFASYFETHYMLLFAFDVSELCSALPERGAMKVGDCDYCWTVDGGAAYRIVADNWCRHKQNTERIIQDRTRIGNIVARQRSRNKQTQRSILGNGFVNAQRYWSVPRKNGSNVGSGIFYGCTPKLYRSTDRAKVVLISAVQCCGASAVV
jgi:hypothetical protein